MTDPDTIPAASDGPLAQVVDRTPISTLDFPGQRYRFVRDGLGRWAYRERREITPQAMVGVGILIVVFLMIARLPNLAFAYQVMAAAFWAVVPLLFALGLILGYIQESIPVVLDAGRRRIWRPRVAPVGGDAWSFPFEEIHAVQVLRTPRGDVGECNLVLRTGRRVHLLSQGRAALMVSEARRIAAVMQVPLWEATALPPGTARPPEPDDQRHEVAHALESGGPIGWGDLALRLKSPAGVALVLVNLGPLACVIFGGWSVLTVFAVYWFENAVVGAFGVLRLALAIPGSAAFWRVKALAIPFFILHYGFFVWMHALLVTLLFSDTLPAASNVWGIMPLLTVLSATSTLTFALPFFLSHGISFAWNYVKREEYAYSDLMMLMSAPYVRVGVLHMVLIATGCVWFVLMPELPSGTGLLSLMTLKTLVDLVAYSIEHEKVLVGAPGSPDGRAPDALHKGPR